MFKLFKSFPSTFIELLVIYAGIGLAIAKKFLEAGATVTILDQDADQLEIVRQTHPQIKVLVSNLADWEATAGQISTAGPYHHLVNNAGIARPAKTLMTIKPEAFDT